MPPRPDLVAAAQRYRTEANGRALDDAIEYLPESTMSQALEVYDAAIAIGGEKLQAALGLVDRFFLLTHICKRHDAMHPWVYARCREVENQPDGHIDLWAREHFKSTIITFAGVLQETLADPDLTVGILSKTRAMAKRFLAQIMRECETNALLRQLYPDVLWSDPRNEAASWSLDGGIVFKRRANPKEQTIEAWGLIDGQPTGQHFGLIVYDDIIDMDAVRTPEMMKTVQRAWELSLNLAAEER